MHSETLFSMVTFELVFIPMLSCLRTTVSDAFAVGSNEYSLCIFKHIAYFRLTMHKYTYLIWSDTVSDRIL